MAMAERGEARCCRAAWAAAGWVAAGSEAAARAAVVMVVGSWEADLGATKVVEEAQMVGLEMVGKAVGPAEAMARAGVREAEAE